MSARALSRSKVAAVTRLNALHPLDAEAATAFDWALQRTRTFRAGRELLAEGQEITETLVILSGWAARVHILEDGRRQVLGVLLPGDLIGLCDHAQPIAASTVVAITDVDTCAAPKPAVSPALASAYALSRAQDEAYMLSQITRLGRLNAHERICDFMLELLERLSLANLAIGGRFVMPMTQTMLADTLGLTSIHVNRTLQALRREGSLIWRARQVVLPHPAMLRRTTGRSPIRVTAGPAEI